MTDAVAPAWYGLQDERLVASAGDGRPAPPLAVLIHSQFRGLILSPAFPCLGAAGAVRRGDYRFALYETLGAPAAAEACAAHMRRQLADTPPDEHPVMVFVAAFTGPPPPTEAAFETSLFAHLRALRDHDEGGAAEPADAHGDPGFLFGGREYFVVGLHPAASRFARRFGWPLLVFNALTHAEHLKATGKYDGMQSKILARDERLQGAANPSLPFSQFAQFSGRAVDAGWRSPLDED